MSVNLLWVLGLGGVIGFLSGLFGVGGGFLMTPMLILMGIPPAVAVGTQSAQILASSVSGVLANLRRKAVDLKMGWVLVVGGMVRLRRRRRPVPAVDAVRPDRSLRQR